MRSRLVRENIVMDSGGGISKSGSNKEYFTKDFGGCTAIGIHTDSGMYGLYHLRSTLSTEPQMIEDAKDSNEPFREWIKALVTEANGETIHFKIGTPRGPLNKSLVDKHPEVGMERYIRGLLLYEIKQLYPEIARIPINFDITMLNMVGVDSVAVTEQEMTCFYHGEVVKTELADYQTDEEIFEHSGWTNTQCLNNIKSFPIDYDGKLLEKYQQRFDLEQMEKAQKKLEAQQKELERQQKDRSEMVKSITDPMVQTLNNLFKRYKSNFDQGSKENKKALNECLFLEDLSRVVGAGDLRSLQEMRKLPYFKQVTENDSFFYFFTKEQSEIGKLFNKAEKLLIHIQELYPEETLGHGSGAVI
ncbi:TPA: hypothetical protein ACTXXA_002585 [Legionella anisa]